MIAARSVLILTNDSKSILDFRWSFITQCRDKGWTVTVACNQDTSYTALKTRASGIGVQVIPLNFDNGRIAPINDLALILKIRRIYKSVRPTHTLLYRIKPVLYGTLASYGLPIQVISTITGLGYIYTNQSLKARCLRFFTNCLYTLTLRRNAFVFVQNKDDHQILLNRRLISPHRSSVIGGSGVVLTDFPQAALPKSLSFIMIARLLKDKGTWEYLQAAAQLKKLYPHVEFKLAGGESKNPSAIPAQEVANFCCAARINYLGHQQDIARILQESSVFVLPSYREGMPRSGLEALSIGRPIITTDTPGCRDLIQGNGLLVPVQDTNALQAAMQYMINHPEELPQMAQASRLLAETVFDVRLVNKQITDKIEAAICP